MREIKFRVFDRTNKCFKYAIFDTGGWDFGEAKFIQPDTEWMQYTGLKDKNGKEIYEGDILAPNCREVRFGPYANPIERGNGWHTFCHHPDYPNLPFSLSYVQVDGSEVIGNIYENPELI